MMDTTLILQQLDLLLKACKLDEAEDFLRRNIENAHDMQDTDCEKTLLNEQIGFFRDCGRFDEALAAAERVRRLFEEHGETADISYATTLLNCANAYRAAGKHQAAFEAYDTVSRLYSELLPENHSLVSSLYNNLALLYQETGEWEKACGYLNDALKIVRSSGDEIKTAISCTNLAVSLIKLCRGDEAEPLLREADEILGGHSPSDFHYSAVLAGLGDLCFLRKEYASAAEYYERALSEIALHMGRNNFYETVTENLMRSYEAAGTSRPELSGIELSRKYFEAFGAPVLKRCFPEIFKCAAVGIMGEGSECLGFDDALSRDHDFGCRFSVWLPDSISDETVKTVNDAYNALPREFYGVERVDTAEAHGRSGAVKIGEYFERLIDMPHIPQTETEWLSADEAMLAAASSGEIFMDNNGEFTGHINALRRGYPDAVRLRRLAQALSLMAQSGQYNYPRIRKRGDIGTAQLYLAKFCINAAAAAHLCRNTYAPYEKWLLKSTKRLEGFSEYADLLYALLTMPPENDGSELISKVCDKIALEASMNGNYEYKPDMYLDEAAQSLAQKAEDTERHKRLVKRITELEWSSFDKVQNIGGRASCQDDFETFSIMRGSQYSVWTDALLERWIEAFEEAVCEGRNLITEKYARMMETTDPEEFEKLKDKLPPLADDFIAIREAVVGIQLQWMQELSERYPAVAAKARSLSTGSDTVYNTSYETYLRGELSTYPPDLLYGYGRWVVELHRNGKNLAEMIMENTVHAYGYQSFEDVPDTTY
ncbi:MAG: DUF4125 family protein [Oscillospiraceae bacterium]|nr:DUF4125 family protein [Oscillospiraceae bacterium]